MIDNIELKDLEDVYKWRMDDMSTWDLPHTLEVNGKQYPGYWHKYPLHFREIINRIPCMSKCIKQVLEDESE